MYQLGRMMVTAVSAATLLVGPVGLVGPAAADHDWGGGDCDWSGQCYGGDEYEHDYSNRDHNRNRGRERGAFSPGPFDDSPVTIGPVCMPGSTCHFEPRPQEGGSGSGGGTG